MKETKNDYVAVLCEQGSRGVGSIVLNGFPNKTEVRKYLEQHCPGHNIKTILKLHEEDFRK